MKAAFVVYSISQTTVDFNGGSIDKIKWELIENDCALASIATVATHEGRRTSRKVAKKHLWKSLAISAFALLLSLVLQSLIKAYEALLLWARKHIVKCFAFAKREIMCYRTL